MSKSDFAERIMAFMRHRTQHFNPQKYFRMRDKVISSAGGGTTVQVVPSLQDKTCRCL